MGNIFSSSENKKCECESGILVLKNADMSKELVEPSGKGRRKSPRILYYGWFFSPEISSVMDKVVSHYFKLCYKESLQFREFITASFEGIRGEVNHVEYYKRPDASRYHVTAKYLGGHSDPQYQTLADDLCGETFYMHLSGIVFTPRTLGVRVTLTKSQELIFDGNCDQSVTASNIEMMIKGENDAFTRKMLIAHTEKTQNPDCKIEMCKKKDCVFFKRFPKDEPTKVKTKSRAHVTIGCAPKVKPVTTGLDLLHVMELEKRESTQLLSDSDLVLEGGILRNFDDYFVFYPNYEMIAPAQFNVVY